ncbi:MAG: MBL fold metallo-hydrolase [Rhodospirillaceae bacterium]
MVTKHLTRYVLAGCLVAAMASGAQAENVEITPLGSHDGEFCAFDRAMLLVDPDGTRILYDVGRTVAGPDDPRLGNVDAVLISHMHGDHVGDRRIGKVNAGTCGEPDASVTTTPNTNSVEIALAKNAKIITGSEMPQFFAGKMKALGGDPANSLGVRFGGSHKIGGVTITTVPAVHSNGISGAFIDGQLGQLLTEAGLTAYAGPPTGYVLTFSNGLVVYLSGDTGVTAEQKTVVAEQYKAQLVVMNIGGVFTTGPAEAAHVINTIIKPKAVIASHANEAATQGGQAVAGSKTATFMEATDVPVYLPLSGRTLSFGSDGACTVAC